MLGLPGSDVCGGNLAEMLAPCEEMGILVATEMVEGPMSCLTFLGIEVDMQRRVLRLPDNKLVRLKTILRQWLSHKSCRRRQLKSLIGSLQHA